jgi:hypothetical protein
MFTDYFYYWKLKHDPGPGCTAVSVIHNNTDLSNFYFAVKQSITFDGTINLTTSAPLNNLTFRATDAIHIQPGFGAPGGSTLHLTITPCN